MDKLCIKTEVRESSIPNAGKGLFSLEFVLKGSIVYIPITVFPNDRIVLEEQYLEELNKTDTFPMNAGVRWGGHYYRYSDKVPLNADYINHSDQPNLLWCLGFYFALHDIQLGDELTLDYKYLGIEGVVEPITRTSEQGEIIGLSARESLLQSAQKLINLLNEVEDIHCFDLDRETD